MVFNFDKPETKDFTETARLLAGLSRCDCRYHQPRSAPLELQVTVPEHEFVFCFNRRHSPKASFRSLLSIGTKTSPITYNMLVDPDAQG